MSFNGTQRSFKTLVYFTVNKFCRWTIYLKWPQVRTPLRYTYICSCALRVSWEDKKVAKNVIYKIRSRVEDSFQIIFEQLLHKCSSWSGQREVCRLVGEERGWGRKWGCEEHVTGRPGTDVMIWKNIFAEKFTKTLAFFAQTNARFCKSCDHNIGFWEKRQFFRRKLSKIAENCDRNIDPRWVLEKVVRKYIHSPAHFLSKLMQNLCVPWKE
jgi:hypothetical protein